MRALVVTPGAKGSAALVDLPQPAAGEGEVLVRARAVGICGTDAEILSGDYGAPPPGEERLVLGHESLGEVVEAPAGSGLAPGDLVAGIVRWPDPAPCGNCAIGEWDMCSNGRFTEHGIKERHGFLRERWRLPRDRLVKVDRALGDAGVLLEPASVVAKAWEHVERIGAARARWRPRKVLVTGAGPIGLLAALLAVQRGLEVHVLDRGEDGPKPRLVRALGATHHGSGVGDSADDADVVLECTGAPELLFEAMQVPRPNGIVCLLGVSSAGRCATVDAGALNRALVLENNVVFGSVNANRAHWEAAAAALARADRAWLQALLSRRVPLERWTEALRREDDDVKVVVTFP
jgi:threonine dehydrogenase-like Zn-dependent dehydrogenase